MKCLLRGCFKSLERNYPRIFWLFIYSLGVIIFYRPTQDRPKSQFQSQVAVEQLRGGESVKNSAKPSSNISTKELKKAIKAKFFPDLVERRDYQRKQAKLFISANRKLSELKRLRILNPNQYLTSEEKDALNYFSGQGFYKDRQAIQTPPNVYDTRQTFLKKMENNEVQREFLIRYNQKL